MSNPPIPCFEGTAVQVEHFAALVARHCRIEAVQAGQVQPACAIVNAIAAIEAAFPMPKDGTL